MISVEKSCETCWQQERKGLS